MPEVGCWPRTPSGPQSAIFSYFHFNPAVHSHEKPYEILINLPSAETNPDTYRRHNQEFENCSTIAQDVRGRESDFTLDRNGVCWRIWPGPKAWQGIDAQGVKNLGHDRIQEEYVKEVEAFIKEDLERQDGKAVGLVKVFDWRLRISMNIKEFESRTINLDDGLDAMIPVTHPHVDQSFDGAVTRVRVHMGDQADVLLKRRFRIVNVWKPLKTVRNWPLAICDSSTVQLQDLVPADLVRRKYVGETYYSTYNPEHRWYYLSGQKPEEITMLKIHDSDKNAAVRFSLHSSFQPLGFGDKDGRESMEVRAMVFDPEE